MKRLAGRIILLWGWRRALAALAAGALAALGQAPWDFFAACFISFPVLVWLLDGAEGDGSRRLPFRLAPAFAVVLQRDLDQSIGIERRMWIVLAVRANRLGPGGSRFDLGDDGGRCLRRRDLGLVQRLPGGLFERGRRVALGAGGEYEQGGENGKTES